jgi:hypothetical protein
MDLPILSAVAGLGAALFTLAQAPVEAASTAVAALGDVVGEQLYASSTPVDRYGIVPRAEDLDLEGLGRVAGIIEGADGSAQGLVVAVGGLWGVGAQEVEVGLDRVHLLMAEEGGTRLVIDLSAEHTAPTFATADL